MITNIILVISGVIIFLLLWNFITGKNKPVDRRTTLEKIACSLFSIFKTNLEEVNRNIQTPKVLRDEAIHEIDDAIRNLKNSYLEGQQKMRISLKKLKDEVLPNLLDQPGILESRARNAKAKFEQTNVEDYKMNAMKYLSYKTQAIKNIDRCKDNIQKLEVSVEESKARYDSNMIDLQMLKTEIESMVDVPEIELSNSLERIHSLQTELETAAREATIRAEVREEMSAQENAVYSTDFDNEFNNL